MSAILLTGSIGMACGCECERERERLMHLGFRPVLLGSTALHKFLLMATATSTDGFTVVEACDRSN